LSHPRWLKACGRARFGSSDARLPLLGAAWRVPLALRPALWAVVDETTTAAVARTDDEASQGGETSLLPRGPHGDTVVDDAVQDLGEVLEVAELRDGARVEGERRGVAAVHPQRGAVEPLAVRLAGATHAAEVAREGERGAGLGRPRVGEEGGDGRGRGARDDVEEEVEAGVPRGDERLRRVLRARLLRRGRRLRSQLVELGVHQV